MNKDYPHILGRVFNAPLMLHPDKLDTVVSVLGPRLGLDQAQVIDASKQTDSVGNVLPRERASVPGQIKSDKAYALTASGVAVIPILGTLVHRAAAASPPSLMWSYGELSDMFLDAVTDPQIKAVLFDISSGGGEVPGAFDFAKQIHDARGIKPIWAAADEHAFSAAYALACAADRVTVARTGAVGSIGVIAMHRDVSEQDKDAGLKYTTVYAGARKNDGNPHEPLSNEAHKRLQASVDKTYNLFVETVAQYRGLSVDKVKGTDADVFGGIDRSAVDAGLADAVMPFRDSLRALTELADHGTQTFYLGAVAAAPQPGSHEEIPMPNANTPASKTDAKPAETTTAAETTTTTETAVASEEKPAQAKGDNVVDLEAARSAGHDQAHTAAAEIAQLCSIAGRPDLTAGYLAEKVSVAAVRNDLETKRAEADDQLGTSSLHGGGDEHALPGATLNIGDVYATRRAIAQGKS